MRTPLWKAEDLGKPIPASRFAITLALPLWDQVIGYEERREDVLSAITSGYPRFVYHPFYRQLCDTYSTYEGPDEFVMALPSERVAEKCVAYVKHGRVETPSKGDVALAIIPNEFAVEAKSFWQHTGLIVSARQAENILNDRAATDGTAAKRAIKEKIAKHADADVNDVYLFPTGMAAGFAAYEAVSSSRGSHVIQYGFCYVDTLRISQKFGQDGQFIAFNDPSTSMEELHSALESGTVSAIFCEVPNNPQLRTIDVPAVSRMAREKGVPFIIDNTDATWLNIDVTPYADATVTSLTKDFSGKGDVMGGSLVLNRRSPFYDELKGAVENNYQDLLYPDDAGVLARNSENFESRMAIVNNNCLRLVEHLTYNSEVDRVLHPTSVDRENFEAIRKPGGGYTSLFSIILKRQARAREVYDRLELDKGPSFGLEQTIVGPQVQLANFHDQSFAAENGAPAHLLRVGVGTEDIKDLLGRFDRALEQAKPS